MINRLAQTMRSVIGRGASVLGRWAALIPIGLALAVFVAGALLIGQLVLSSFKSTIVKVQNWQDTNTVSRTGVAAGDLFAALLANRERPLIRFDKSSGTLETPVDCAVENAGLGPNWKTSATRKLITRFCQTDVGRAIAGEIRIWNNIGQVLGIRDNRHRGRACSDGRLSTLYVPAKCFESEWQAGVVVGAQVRPADVPSGSNPSTETFGFMADGAPPGFGDWLTVKVNDVGLRQLVFSTVIAPTTTEQGARKFRQVAIDVIGDVDAVRVNGVVRQVRISAAKAGEKKSADEQSAAPVVVVRNEVGALICDRQQGKIKQCDKAISDGRSRIPRGRRILLKAGSQPLRVEIFARALRVLPPSILSLRTAQMIDQSGENVRELVPTEPVLRLTSHIAISCIVQPVAVPDTADDGENIFSFRRGPRRLSRQRRCWLNWRARTLVSQRQPGFVSIVASGGDRPVALTRRISQAKDKAGKPRSDLTVASELAGQLGLLPVVGLDQTDYFSLLGQATIRSKPQEVARIDLTIDPQLQMASLDILGKLARREKAPKDVLRRLVKRGDKDRRAVVVLLDAGPLGGGTDEQTGAIRAVVSFPAFRRGLSRWDVLANERFRPTQSRLAARGWAQSDRFFAPGSTMKVLTTLAAIDKAARGDRQLARLLPGHEAGAGLAQGEVDRFFVRPYGWSLHSTAIQVPFGDDSNTDKFFVIRNHPGRVNGKRVKRDLCQSVTGACNPTIRLDNSRALVRSSNMWFARLALALDEDAVSCRTATGRREILSGKNPCTRVDPGTGVELSDQRVPIMMVIANRVWNGLNRNLIADFEAQNWRPADRGARFQAEAMRLDVANPNRPRRVSLALNGIGQAAQATPLAMATLMASVATGSIISPRLSTVRRPDAVLPLIPREGGPLGDADSVLASNMLGGLRRALRNVARSGAGTAFNGLSQVRDLRGRMFGKTGTAQVGKRPGVNENPPNTAWFVGWIDGLGNGRYKNRRLAFACAITHVRKSPKSGRPAGTGGSVCAPVIGAILKQFETREGGDRTSQPAGRTR